MHQVECDICRLFRRLSAIRDGARRIVQGPRRLRTRCSARNTDPRLRMPVEPPVSVNPACAINAVLLLS